MKKLVIKLSHLSIALKLSSLFLIALLAGCSTTNTAPLNTTETQDNYVLPNINSDSRLLQTKVISNASKYIGTRYQWGGTSKKGMDCSGLVYVAFSEAGTTIPKNKVKVGDLIFFHTHSRNHAISHVGIVEKVQKNKLFFIHVSLSEGVMISSSQNSYWKPRIVKFVRVINN